MRIGTWFFLGEDARAVHRGAKQCAAEMSRSNRRLAHIKRLQDRLTEVYAKLREAAEDKEQLKGILKVVAPEQLENWKRSRQAEKVAGL